MGEYTRTVLKHWTWLVVALVGLIGDGATVVGSFNVPRWVWYVVILIGLAGAQFFAFRDVARQRDEALKQRDEARGLDGLTLVHNAGGQIGSLQIRGVYINKQDSVAIERQRRNAVLAQLHLEWILRHDGLTPAMLAGKEELPRQWVETRLGQIGETWRQDDYVPGRALPPGEAR